MIKKVILHCKGKEHTEKLLMQIPDAILYDASDSNDFPQGIQIQNEGFTANCNRIISDFLNEKEDNEYICIMNNDIVLDNPDNFWKVLSNALIQNPTAVIASAAFNSYYVQCEKQGDGVRFVNDVEFTAPVISKTFLKRVDGYPKESKFGWGIDQIMGHYARQLGFRVMVVDSATFHHIGHVSAIEMFQSKDEYFRQAWSEYSKVTEPLRISLNRTDVINRIIKNRKVYGFRTKYLEIGYGDGVNYSRIYADSKNVCDPFMTISCKACRDKIKMKSEDYLNTCISQRIRYDVIFIDGSHVYEDIKKDFELAMQAINPDGVIIFHDVNPATEWHTRDVSEFKEGEEWCGGAWRAFIEACYEVQKSGKKALSYAIGDDYGIGIIDFRIGIDIPHEITKNCINRIQKNDFSYFDVNRNRLLNMILPKEFNLIYYV